MKHLCMKEEAAAFDHQIKERILNGHIPDLRRSGRCEYFYNNVWRDQEFADLYYGELVKKVIRVGKTHFSTEKKKRIKVLEVGCGPGQISLELARYDFDVSGIDISNACIETARKIADQDPWISERGDLEYFNENLYDHSGIYDIVLFAASLHHFPDCYNALKHANSLLNINGIIVADEPIRDQVSSRNIAMILFIKGLLSATKSFYEEFELPLSVEKANEFMKKIYAEEKYELEDGTKSQSIHDNESGFNQMYAALSTIFDQLEFKREYAFFHQIIGGIRLNSIEKEHKLSKFIKLMDSILCRNNAIDPTNFYFVGRKRANA